jgi:serine/threonine protein kinase
MQINRYKIIKKISSGGQGIVYLVKYKNKLYAMKIEKILESDIKKSLKSSFWREIDFTTNLCSKNQSFFMKLYNYDIINNYNFSLNNPYNSDYLKNLNKSLYCTRKIYEYIDTTLDKIINKLKIYEFYSILIQIAYIIYLMQKKGYMHNNLHAGNIGINKTKKKYIIIFNKKLPTYNRIVKLIDYGTIYHNKYIFNSNNLLDKYNLSNKNSDIRWLVNLSYNIPFYNKVPKNFWANFNFQKNQLEFLNSNNLILVNNLVSDKNDKYLLFCLLYPDLFQNFLLKSKFDKVINNILRLPIEDIIYLMNATHINNYKEIKKIIIYFFIKLKNIYKNI